MATTSAKKGKSSDRSSPWSEYEWDDRGWWYKSRYNEIGDIEYMYQYAGSEQLANTAQTPWSNTPQLTASSLLQGTNRGGSLDPNFMHSSKYAAYSPASQPFQYSPPATSASANTGTRISASLSTDTGSTMNNSGVGTLADEFGSLGIVRPSLPGDVQYVGGTATYNEEPDSKYQTINEPSRFFKIGRVFKVLWAEPAGNQLPESGPFVMSSSFGAKAFSKARRFVVIREMQGCSLCLPLNTYNGQGAAKSGINSQDHAAVYPLGGTPYQESTEKLSKSPFPIIVEEPTESIDPMSRLNFGKVYTVEYNVKVAKIGRIPDEDLERLNRYFLTSLSGFPMTSVTSMGIQRNQPNQRSSNQDVDSPTSLSTLTRSPSVYDVSMGANYTTYARSLSAMESVSSGLDNCEISANMPNRPRQLARGRLDPRYCAIKNKNLNKFWCTGRVFMMLWTEPASDTISRRGQSGSGSHITGTYLSGSAFTEIRRFVVLTENHGSAICSPINSYGNQATLKPNLADRMMHAIIYTSDSPPPEKVEYAADGSVIRSENLIRDPIRVCREQYDKEGDLGPYARINYSKIYTVEMYVRVLNIGIVHQDSMNSLENNSLVRIRTDSLKGKGRHTKDRRRK